MDQPRVPAGSPEGGQFAKKGSPERMEKAKRLKEYHASQVPSQVQVKLHGRDIKFSKKSLQEMLEKPDQFRDADNLPRWIQHSLLGTAAVPKVAREHGGAFSNKAFERAAQAARNKIAKWKDSPTKVKITISERGNRDRKWLRDLKEE
jgi:hypothetical protein